MANIDESYEIGAVSQLTGISSHVLRVWERRYDVVEPSRTDSKRRRYNKTDIQRLTLIKTLVDNGQSIGTVARLDQDQLLKRIEELPIPSPDFKNTLQAGAKGRIVVVGSLVKPVVRDVVDREAGLSLAGEFNSIDEVVQTLVKGGADLLIFECPTLFPESLDEIQAAIDSCGISKVIVVYQFGAKNCAEQLETASVTALRSPVAVPDLLRAIGECVDLTKKQPAKNGKTTPSLELSDKTEFPARSFSDSDLARIGRYSSVVKCECPNHLAALLSSLGAFEKYSSECESRNSEDAALHSYLHHATAACRAEMEKALIKVLVHEGIAPEFGLHDQTGSDR